MRTACAPGRSAGVNGRRFVALTQLWLAGATFFENDPLRRARCLSLARRRTRFLGEAFDRYKLFGKVIHANDEYLIAFDLSGTAVYQRVFKEGEKPKTSRTPGFPEGWQNQFGMPFKEHRNSMQVNIFEGYAVYSIKENNVTEAAEAEKEAHDTVPVDTSKSNSPGGPDV